MAGKVGFIGLGAMGGPMALNLVKAGFALVVNDIALYVAHTNADVASPGVNDALARVIGLQDLSPLVAEPITPTDKIVKSMK